MVETFQGSSDEVKRQMNEWFAEHSVKVEYGMQDHVRGELCVTIIYTELREVELGD